MMKSSRGFTLIELLVVIAVIAVLAAVLFPVLLSARESAKQASCAANMAELAKAALMYADANNGRLPPYDYNPGTTQLTRVMWYDCLFPYVKTKSILRCPSLKYNSDAEEQWWQNPKSLAPMYNRIAGIGVATPHVFWSKNSANNTKPPGLVLAIVRRPTRIMMMTDTYILRDLNGNPTTIERGFPCCYCPGCCPNGGMNAGKSYDPLYCNISDRHRGGANVAFLDTHIRWVKRETLVKRFTLPTDAPETSEIWGHFDLPGKP
ncbi:MAG: type II secretion system protein [Armatimonadota bacterium]|nr:type II secretion system protein [Armatimonadota bacterium]